MPDGHHRAASASGPRRHRRRQGSATNRWRLHGGTAAALLLLPVMVALAGDWTLIATARRERVLPDSAPTDTSTELPAEVRTPIRR